MDVEAQRLQGLVHDQGLQRFQAWDWAEKTFHPEDSTGHVSTREHMTHVLTMQRNWAWGRDDGFARAFLAICDRLQVAIAADQVEELYWC